MRKYEELYTEAVQYARHNDWIGTMAYAYIVALAEACKDLSAYLEAEKPQIHQWSPPRCPRCGKSLNDNCDDGYYEMTRPEHCPNCDQKLLPHWEVET